MAQYDEYRNSGSTLLSNYPKPNGIVRVVPLEFVCDVETSAAHLLTGPEYLFFKGFYLDVNERFMDLVRLQLGPGRYASVKKRVQQKAGKGFEERGLFPINLYNQRIDCR